MINTDIQSLRDGISSANSIIHRQQNKSLKAPLLENV